MKALTPSKKFAQDLFKGASPRHTTPVQNQWVDENTPSWPQRSLAWYQKHVGSFHGLRGCETMDDRACQEGTMFATQDRNALLLYNGRFNEKHDFIALEIVDEQLQLTFSAGLYDQDN
ncbi:hypothetical protein A6R68_15235 [Neotoma lepida]|uniref:Laminin G domain-containing protein n=1 Tax=Neotoma lepida TaxID=56216 RepID=A0A1A6H9D4_NEOLE|nr:hypothetical protein A6R68_15235 [Neotoma lepida]